VELNSRNLTLHLPADLIRQAKVYAAERDTSINTLVREFLEQTVSSQDRMRAAGARILEIARRGLHSSVDPASIRRDEIHERW
jgi:plasmid stability protein